MLFQAWGVSLSVYSASPVGWQPWGLVLGCQIRWVVWINLSPSEETPPLVIVQKWAYDQFGSEI